MTVAQEQIEAPRRPDARRGQHRKPTTGPRVGPYVKLVLRILLIAVAAIVLWPASWGGITGLTVVQGHSMEPVYHTGDLVLTIRQSNYEVGDVISYVVPEGQPGAGGRVIHRIAVVDTTDSIPVYVTKGDNNPDQDIWRITADNITGKAFGHLGAVGKLFAGNTYPFIVGAAAGMIVMVLLWPSRTRSSRRAHEQHTSQDEI